jgi:NAD+ kinase|uniref:NAD kinase n=1 Tax=Candidatus Planktophila sp. TaxID=2175601 RepID=UPI00404A2ECA
MSQRNVLIFVNSARAEAKSASETIISRLNDENIKVYLSTDSSIPAVELVLVLGGDGTILRGAEYAVAHNVPLLGINLGHVGFMAEVEAFTYEDVAEAVINKDYVSDERMLLSFEVKRKGSIIESGWALNEVSIERKSTTMVELFVQIDNRPLSRWGCDGIICATPTGSTAYAFSAGGPVLWPEVQALVLLPIAAHALFAKPMVIAPSSTIGIDIESSDASLSADALRKIELKKGDEIAITKSGTQITLAHLKSTIFTDRLVAKFKLPVEGWRGE